MRRKTFDAIFMAGGLVLAIVLAIAGSLLFWGHSFADDHVKTELSAQKIIFPPKGSDALASPEIGPYLNKYAGQQLTTGEQAKAYADHFIAVHLEESTGGRSYAELSTASRANPTDEKLAGLVQTSFRGETLRGLLLNAYAWSKMGEIAFIASIVSFILAGVMFVLSALGAVHMRRVSPETEILLGGSRSAKAEETAPAMAR